MDFLALIPEQREPSGRLEHLPSDLLNLILQTTAQSPKEKKRREDADEYDRILPPYRPHNPNLVSNFLMGSRRLAKVYIDFHIRRLPSFQTLKVNNLPVSLIFEVSNDETYTGLPPGFYLPIVHSCQSKKRCIEPCILCIHNSGMPTYAWINVELNSTIQRSGQRRGNWSHYSSLDYAIKNFTEHMSEKRVTINCII